MPATGSALRAAALLHAAAVVHGMSAAMAPGAMTSDPVWMRNMANQVHDALLEAEQLERAATISPSTVGHAASHGGALVREATIRGGELENALDRFQTSLLHLDFQAGCRISVVLDDPATLDTSFLCLWLEDALERNATQPNGADMYEQLRASRPANEWAQLDHAHSTFAAEYYEGAANEGFYPARWMWLTRGTPSREARLLTRGAPRERARQANASLVNASLVAEPSPEPAQNMSPEPAQNMSPEPAQNATLPAVPRARAARAIPTHANTSHEALRGAMGSIHVLEGLAVTKVMGVFRAGEVGKGCQLFDGLILPQLGAIPGIVAAASLHDPALQKLLALMVWRSAEEQGTGEAKLASVLNISVALQPFLREPLISERWPDATVFWPEGGPSLSPSSHVRTTSA